ncbi:MAG: hypothetical protein V1734_04545 [Nanoarchaeota archaeon]
MATLEKAIIDIYAESFVKEIVSIIKQPENIKILWDYYSVLSDKFNHFSKGSCTIMPPNSLQPLLEKAKKELSEMLDLSSSYMWLGEKLCIMNDDSDGRSYFKPSYLKHSDCGRYTQLIPVIGIHSENMNEISLYPTIAHELAHFFQDCGLLDGNGDWKDLKFLKEGFARGVERIIAQNEATRKRKLSFVSTTLARIDDDITEFASNGYKKDAEKQLHHEGHWGSCAFVIAETRHGQGIYKDMINSPQPYELLVDMLGGRR